MILMDDNLGVTKLDDFSGLFQLHHSLILWQVESFSGVILPFEPFKESSFLVGTPHLLIKVIDAFSLREKEAAISITCSSYIQIHIIST